MQCERHKTQRDLQDEIGECNDCRIESWLLDLTAAIFEIRQAVSESIEFVKDSKSYQNWARLEALDKSLKGFIEYYVKNQERWAKNKNNKSPVFTGGV